MIYIDELKDLKLYSKPFLLPRNKINKLKGNMAFLLTPNYNSSKNLINHPLMINKYYHAYYLEKDVSLYINNEGAVFRYDNEQYIHEADEGPIQEGYFNSKAPAVIYNGFDVDVNEARNFINYNTIYTANSVLKAPIVYPVSVTVYRNETNVPIMPNSINISSYNYMRYASDQPYDEYCLEAIYEMLLKNINKDIDPYICNAMSMALTGTKIPDDVTEYKYLVASFRKLMDKGERGYRTLYKIAKDSTGNKAMKQLLKYDMELFKDAVRVYESIEPDSILEGKMDPIKLLKRNLTYSANKGSKHILNKVVKKIEDTVDPTVPNPDYKLQNTEGDPTGEKNREDKKDIEVPTVDSSVELIPTPSTGSGSSTNEEYTMYDLDGAYLTPLDESVVDYTYIPNDEIEVNEDYIYADRMITSFDEASNNYSAGLKKLLYKERIRTNKQIINIYDQVKLDNPQITRTYLTYERYKGYNTFVDLYYYNDLFFKNNMYKMQKGADLYFSLLKNLVSNKKLRASGYNGKKIMFIPILDWTKNPNTKMWMYTKDINPISIIYQHMLTDLEGLKELFGDMDIVFITDTRYFKINFTKFEETDKNKFLLLIRKLLNAADGGMDVEPDDLDDAKDSYNARVDAVVDKLEDSKVIKVHHLTGDNKENEKIDEEIIKKIEDAAKKADSAEDTEELLNNDEEFKKMLLAITAEEDATGAKMNNSRTARMDKLNDELMAKSVKGKKIEDILENRKEMSSEPLKKVDIPVESINPEWHELAYPSMATQYDPNDDIVAILYALSKTSYPLSIRDIQVEDTSTSEDFIYTYTVEFESHLGKRFKIRFDVPKLSNGQYMVLRGNNKVISTQSFLMPILKTDLDTVQIISNYNKIFIRRFNTSTGKSNMYTNIIMKVLEKKEYKNVKVVTGINDVVCNRYEVPIDYIDLAAEYSTITIDKRTIMFNPKKLYEELEKNKIKVDNSKGLPVGIDYNNKECIYYKSANDGVNNTFSQFLFYWLGYDSEIFADLTNYKVPNTRYTYSKASILSSEIPVVVLAAYSVGLIKVLETASIDYELKEKLDRKDLVGKEYIKFSDGYLVYKMDYSSSLLMNGLKECDTAAYSLGDINSRSMYLDFLDQFGGRIKADGLDNFYDCMIDPITEDILNHYNLPTDYISLLIYANNLLADNKYIKHGDQSARRLRRNELIAGYTYKAISSAYGQYTQSLKHGRETTMSMKQSAVIDLIMLDPTFNDLSTINALNEKESYDLVSPKGLSGMNSDRSYSLDKRSFDDSMINILGMSTGFAGTVGINRQATLNANVDSVRGYIQPGKEEDMNSVNTMCMSEALTPFACTRDDPFRTAMTFVQTTRHGMRVAHGDPSLVTSGADQALPYLISDIFAYKAKSKGEVIEFVADDYMIVKYDNGESDYIDLSETVEKNSSSGFYVPLKLSTDLKLGSKVKEGQLLAYDKSSFNNKIGIDDNPAYNIGTLVYCALLSTDESFEDSASISNRLTYALASDVVVQKAITLDKNTNVYNLLPIGTKVEEGQTLMVTQSAFDDEDANILLKNLAADEDEISELGRVPIHSKITGVIQDIDIYRTVELEELSESLQKLCKQYEKKISSKEAVLKKYNIENNGKLKPNYKLNASGKLKDTVDGVKIIIYLKYLDRMSVGDKLIYQNANKGVIKYIYPEGKEPYFISNPNEKLDTLVSVDSANARMVTSIQNIGITNYLLVEAARKAQRMAGITPKEDLFDTSVVIKD